MPVFEQRSELGVSREALYRWHMNPGAFERLTPPWEPVEVVQRQGDGVSAGSRLTLRTRVGPAAPTWQAEIRSNTPGEGFVDVQTSGPFARWEHQHSFLEGPTPGRSVLVDRVDYALPVGALGEAVAGDYVHHRLERMFRWRHTRTAEDLARHALLAQPLRFAVSGASGLVGRELVPFLTGGGHRVQRLVRRPPQGPDEVRWDPAQGELDREALEGVDVLIHLAGENVGEGRWTAARKRAILDSREQGTRLLAQTAAALTRRPRALISASAVGFYGDTGEGVVDESAPSGEGFLAEVCRVWEASTAAAAEAGVRVVQARIGVVLDPRGGALQRLLPPFRAGVGGPVGSGAQGFPWVGLDDLVYALHWLAAREEVRGPVNIVAPQTLSQRQFAQGLGAVLGRPARIPLPGAALELAFGEMAREVLLAGQRVEPAVLRQGGFVFTQPALAGHLGAVLGL